MWNESISDKVSQFYKARGGLPDALLGRRLILEEYGEWDDAAEEYNTEAELKELADLVYVIYGYALVRGWDLGTAVNLVHESNMTKFPVTLREDGKVLKGPNYKAPDLSGLV